jgi:hypothetical protein
MKSLNEPEKPADAVGPNDVKVFRVVFHGRSPICCFFFTAPLKGRHPFCDITRIPIAVVS